MHSLNFILQLSDPLIKYAMTPLQSANFLFQLNNLILFFVNQGGIVQCPTPFLILLLVQETLPHETFYLLLQQ